MLRALVLGLLALLGCKPAGDSSVAEPGVNAGLAAICPVNARDIPHPDLWPRCPVRRPVMGWGGVCADGPGCMKPCGSRHERITIADGKSHDVKERRHRYDESGRLIASVEVSGDTEVPHLEISYAGDRLAEMRELERYAAAVTSYDYDEAGRLTGLTMKATEQTFRYQFEFDEQRRLLRILEESDGRFEPTEVLTYDDSGRLLSSQVPGGASEAYEYKGDRVARVVITGEEAHAVTYQYDGRGRATRITRTHADPDFDHVVAFRYDGDGRLVQDATTWGTHRLQITYAYQCDDAGAVPQP